MLVYDPLMTDIGFNPQIIEIAVVWQDDTHIVGDVMPVTSDGRRRILVEKSEIPTAEEIEVLDNERLRRMIRDHLSPMKNEVRNDTLRAILKLIIEETK